MVLQAGEAAEAGTVPGAITPGEVGVVVKEKEEDGEGGLMATPLMMMIGPKMTEMTTTTSPLVEGAEVVVVRGRETPCWRFSRG